MRVLINDHAYEIGRKAFRGVLDIAKKSSFTKTINYA